MEKNSKVPNVVEDCEEMATFTSQVFFSLGVDEDKFRSLFDKCSLIFSKQQKAFYNLLLEKDKKILLNKVPFEKEEKKIFLDTHRKKKQDLNKLKKFISFFEDLLVFLETKKDSKKGLDKAIDFLSAVDSFESAYLKSLVEILLAIKFDNFYRVEKRIKFILKIDPAYFIFNPIFPGVKKSERIILETTLFKAFAFIKGNLKDKVLKKVFFTYLNFYYYFQKEEFKALLKDIDINWNLLDIRELSKDNRDSSEYLFFLSYLLIKKKLYSESFLLLKENLKEKKIKEMSFAELSLLVAVVDTEIIKTTFFKEKITSLLRQKNDYYKYLIFKVMEHKSLKDLISGIDGSYKRANFQLEYSFYSKKLISSHFKHFCLYKLLKLGHKKKSMLWWLIQ